MAPYVIVGLITVLYTSTYTLSFSLMGYLFVLSSVLKGHCIEFKYYADGIHSGLTPPG